MCCDGACLLGDHQSDAQVAWLATNMVDAPTKGTVAAVTAMLISVALLVEASALLLLLLHGEVLSGWCAAAQVLVHVCVAKVENDSNSILKLQLNRSVIVR
jgi:hypothetical protein